MTFYRIYDRSAEPEYDFEEEKTMTPNSYRDLTRKESEVMPIELSDRERAIIRALFENWRLDAQNEDLSGMLLQEGLEEPLPNDEELDQLASKFD